jgi:hypothetical protein
MIDPDLEEMRVLQETQGTRYNRLPLPGKTLDTADADWLPPSPYRDDETARRARGLLDL